MKLARFIYIINSFNLIDFKQNLTISKGNFKFIICIFCLRDTVCIFCEIFVKLAQFIYVINGLNPIDFEINLTISKQKVAISRYIFLNYLL